MNILITGGAGFIGTHLTRRLLAEGCNVTILDNFSQQIHGENQSLPLDIAPYVEHIVGDVRDRAVFARALAKQDVVVHLAAETGTGQSMYQVQRYEQVNLGGTAILFDLLINTKNHVGNVIVASSRAIYGEGKYVCAQHGIVYPDTRRIEDLQAGVFEPRCPLCSITCESLPTDEVSPLQPASFYGLTKQTQEQMTLLFTRTLGIHGFALRYQNVYGPGQSLQNPYTGILAIFSNQARSHQPIYIFEDGNESRDFVYIDDVVEATYRCISYQSSTPNHVSLNVGSGEGISVKQVVDAIIAFFQSTSEVSITGEFRIGDIRHNVADLNHIYQTIGYVPTWYFQDGVKNFLQWAAIQERAASNYHTSLAEMRTKGLMR